MIEKKINGLKHKTNKQKKTPPRRHIHGNFSLFKMGSSAIEVLVDWNKEGHNALGVWDPHCDHVIHVKHARNTSIPNGNERKGWRLVM